MSKNIDKLLTKWQWMHNAYKRAMHIHLSVAFESDMLRIDMMHFHCIFFIRATQPLNSHT